MFPSHPLFRRFENEVTVGGQKLEWTTRGADLFARPINSPLDNVWCWPTEFIVTLRTGDSEQAQRLIRGRMAYRYRFYALSKGDALLLRATHGFLRSHKSPLLLRFSLPRHFWKSHKILKMETSPLHLLVERLMQQDELRLVQELAGQVSSPWKWFVWRRGSLEELEPLIKALFVLVDNGKFSFKAQQNYEQFNFHEALSFQLWNEDENEGVEEWLENSQACQIRLADILSRFFEAHANVHIERLSIHPPRLSGGRDCRIDNPVTEQPSAHQRLEAMMVWREFLRDKLPAEEIQALLPKL